MGLLGSVGEVTHFSQKVRNYRRVGRILLLEIEDPNLTIITLIVFRELAKYYFLTVVTRNHNLRIRTVHIESIILHFYHGALL